VEPIDALSRIAFLLEAEEAPIYKVRAFRHAADALALVAPAEVAKLAARRGLTSIPGIGDTSATVITEALDGKVPAYLAELEDREAAPVSARASEILAALAGDCHSHSEWSDGSRPVEEMARTARDLGRHYLVMTDHSPRLTVAHGLDAERLRRQLLLIEELNETLAPFRILTGIEVDILEDGSLDQDDELLAELDVVVASVHSKLSMEPAAMTRRMIAAIEHPHTDILGHCTGRLLKGKGRPPSRFDPGAVFAACAATGTAVEINSRPERRDPPHELLSYALEVGCVVSIDTDAHAPGQLSWLAKGAEQAAAAGVETGRIVNTLSAESLLAWTAAHSS
jgi:putative hydrolase